MCEGERERERECVGQRERVRGFGGYDRGRRRRPRPRPSKIDCAHARLIVPGVGHRKVNVRLHGKGDSNSHGARTVY